jgi:hypothetical protein
VDESKLIEEWESIDVDGGPNDVAAKEPEQELAAEDVADDAVTEAATLETQDDAEHVAAEAEPQEADGADFKELYRAERRKLKSAEGRFKQEQERLRQENLQYHQLLNSSVAAQQPAQKKQALELSDIPDEYRDDFVRFVGENPDLQSVAVGTDALSDSFRQMLYEMGPTSAAAFGRLALESKRQGAENAALQSHVRQGVTAAHFSQIAAKHPDYVQVGASADFQQWVQGQPKFLADAYSRVAASGGADEVVYLLDQFKSAKGVKPKAQAHAPSNGGGQVKRPVQTGYNVRSGPSVIPDANQPFDAKAVWDELEV